jgi:hypothetical protein
MRRRRAGWIVICIAVLSGILWTLSTRREALEIGLGAVTGRIRGGYSIADRLAQFGESATSRLRPSFDVAELAYPPAETMWVVFKDERLLHVHARCGEGEEYRPIRSYAVLGASGTLGPKLREGDRQVPEGIYRVVLLNPNSLYHVSLRLDYPNAFDRRMAAADGRTNLGGDIMIHGRSGSVGCLAMGDEAAEDLFTLAAAVGHERVTVVIAPTDLRRRNAGGAPPESPPWTRDLYADLRSRLAACPK